MRRKPQFLTLESEGSNLQSRTTIVRTPNEQAAYNLKMAMYRRMYPQRYTMRRPGIRSYPTPSGLQMDIDQLGRFSFRRAFTPPRAVRKAVSTIGKVALKSFQYEGAFVAGAAMPASMRKRVFGLSDKENAAFETIGKVERGVAAATATVVLAGPALGGLMGGIPGLSSVTSALSSIPGVSSVMGVVSRIEGGFGSVFGAKNGPPSDWMGVIGSQDGTYLGRAGDTLWAIANKGGQTTAAAYPTSSVPGSESMTDGQLNPASSVVSNSMPSAPTSGDPSGTDTGAGDVGGGGILDAVGPKPPAPATAPSPIKNYLILGALAVGGWYAWKKYKAHRR